MLRRFIVVLMVVSSLSGAAAALAQGDPVVTALADYFEVPAADIEAWMDKGARPGDIAEAFVLADMTGLTLEEVLVPGTPIDWTAYASRIGSGVSSREIEYAAGRVADALLTLERAAESGQMTQGKNGTIVSFLEDVGNFLSDASKAEAAEEELVKIKAATRLAMEDPNCNCSEQMKEVNRQVTAISKDLGSGDPAAMKAKLDGVLQMLDSFPIPDEQKVAVGDALRNFEALATGLSNDAVTEGRKLVGQLDGIWAILEEGEPGWPSEIHEKLGGTLDVFQETAVGFLEENEAQGISSPPAEEMKDGEQPSGGEVQPDQGGSDMDDSSSDRG